MSSVTRPDTKAIHPPHSEVEQVALPHLWPLGDSAIKIITVCLAVFEGLLAAALFILAYWMRHSNETPFLAGEWQIGLFEVSLPYDFHPTFAPYLSVLYFVPFIQIATFGYRGMYRLRGEFSFLEDFINIFKAISIGFLMTTMIAFFFRGGFEYSEFSYLR
jgi:hypothetical protein